MCHEKENRINFSRSRCRRRFLVGRFVERVVTVKSLVDRIEDVGGSDDLEDYLYDRYGENSGEDEDEDELYDEDGDIEEEDDDDADNEEDEDDGDKTPSVKVMEMSDEEFKNSYGSCKQ